MNQGTGDDGLSYWCGGSLFDLSGKRLNEVDPERPIPKKISDYSAQDWVAAAAALRAFDAGLR